MLTEPTGNYALRSLKWNAINGNESRELSGKILTDTYSRYSILSSTPIPDRSFVEAFQLFIPLRVVYGNPSSPKGTVYMDIKEGVQINIRTFDHRYGDPNTGSFLNHSKLVSTRNENFRVPEELMMVTDTEIYRDLKRLLSLVLIDVDPYRFSNYELLEILNDAFEGRQQRGRNNE
jgi:hypothetical protein